MRQVAHVKSMDDDRRPQLVHDALIVLDKYSARLGDRDPVKSLAEDQNELLHRVRVALQLLMSRTESHDEATDLVARIDSELSRLS
jgi:hypothetical protein